MEATKAEVTRQLRCGHSPIAVIVRNNEGIGGLGLPSLDQQREGTSLRLESFGNPAGIEARRWEAAGDDTRWETVMIDAGPGSPQTGALLTWYRLNFELQPTSRGVWVPWRLRLNATGNGFLYLNGHPLGSYWRAGSQHDFFLRECWLNFGQGRTNLRALSLRPVDKGAAIQSAVVETYSKFAEKR